MKANSEIATLVNAVEMGIKRDKETESLLHIVKMCREASQKDDVLYFFRLEIMKEVVMVDIYDAQKDIEMFQETACFGESPSKIEALEKKIKELLEEVKENNYEK